MQAAFSADTTSGCAPLVVKFKDETAGSPTSWRWELGNGTISFLKDPAATYFNPGTYSVKLVVANSTGKDSVIKTNYITVYATPSVNFSASSNTGCFPLNVIFEDQSLPGDGQIIKWEWDFGDGTGDTVSKPQHVYTQAGSFNVSLRVTSSKGCSRTLTRNNYIRLNNGVAAAFSSSIPGNCQPPAPVSFTNSTVGTGSLNYIWDFGDGQTSTEVHPNHIYSLPGSYNVLLHVRNESGCVDTQLVVNAVTVGDVTPDFTIPSVVCTGAEILFLNQSLPSPQNVRWSFGDNTYSNELNPVKAFANAGAFTVKMVADFGSCIDSISKVVNVSPVPPAYIEADDTGNCQAPHAVQFSLNATNISRATWYFGDGDSSQLLNPQHTYTRIGEYDVTVVFFNDAGCRFTLTRQNYIRIRPAAVQAINLPKEGCVPLNFQPRLLMDGSDSLRTYLWDFGDGTTSTLPQPVKSYEQAGTYTVRVYYTTFEGCTDSLIYPAAIRAGNIPVAKLFATPSTVCAFKPVQFADSSIGAPADQWLWRFGDGGISTDQHPSHLYRDTGVFDVTLFVWNNGCMDSITMNDYITVKPPIAFFIDSSDCNQPFRRWFRDRSIGATSWKWNFGDGAGSSDQNPNHVYNAQGLYVVTLVVSNDTCEHTFEQTISIVRPSAIFDATDTLVCKGEPVTFTAASHDENAEYTWNFGDGVISVAGFSINHVYTQTGHYTVELIVRDRNGCTDTIVKDQYIQVTGPTASFSTASIPVCTNTPVTFADSSHTDGNSPIRQWIWNYGDGNTDSLASGPFTHAYAASGNFSVTLEVLDSSGCSDKITLPAVVRISRPAVDFISPDTLSCTGKTVQFINRSAGNQLKYLWDYGTGITTDAVHPEILYQTEGDYTIRLAAIDRYGCIDSLIKHSYIRIHDPVASLTVSDTVATCPPLVVQFENMSEHAIAWEWHFGDGTRSKESKPGHFYSSPGKYVARLIVTGYGGCTDTVSQQIIVRGPEGDFTYDHTGGCEPTAVQFRAITSDSTSFVWDFDDGAVMESFDETIAYTYTRRGSYVPKMILVDPQGCRVPVQGKDTIHIYGITPQFEPSTTIVCDSGIVTFSNTTVANEPIINYDWRFGDGQTSDLRSPRHNYTNQGQYAVQLIATTATGCTDTARSDIPIRVSQKPVITITGDSTACIPAFMKMEGLLHTTDTAIINWKWDAGNGTTYSVQQPPAFEYNTAGSYMVNLTATNNLGCSGTYSRTIEAYPLPPTTAPADTLLCRGSSFLLTATGAQTYNWSPATWLSCTGCDQTLAVPDSTILYRVQGLNQYGCRADDSVMIKVQQPVVISATGGDTLCIGNTLQLSASGAEVYSWSPASGLNDPRSPTPIAKPTVSVVYTVTGKDAHNCFSDTANVPVVVYPYPLVDAGADHQIGAGGSITLHPAYSSDVQRIKWSPPSGLDCATCPFPIAKPKETTTYQIEVANKAGCIARDEMTVHVFCNNGNLYIPNTFSPNGDGSNEAFYPRGSGIFSVKTFRIFNRWGELIFERSDFQANDPSQGWTGRHKGKPAPQDVYVYTVEILCENRLVLNFKGNVVLIR